MHKEEQKQFLLHALGLNGPYWPASEAHDRVRRLAMVQIDSIRVTGLRNHEIAWAARTDAPIEGLYDLFYDKRGMIETHYPLFATRREWLPWFLKDFTKYITRRTLHQELRPMMRQILRRIRDEGPVSPADFDTERISGGFNTIKASTRALEYLYFEGKVQIAGRTKHFHRLFDLTEKVAPEAVKSPEDWRKIHPDFFARSALEVLKLASRRQWQERLAHHWNPRGGMADAEKMLNKFIQNLPEDIAKVGEDSYAFKGDIVGWEKARKVWEHVRFLAPLDNLLYNRKRFSDFFGLNYKFEAYTPLKQRRFYYALLILYKSDIVGLIDPKKRGQEWHIDGIELIRPVPMDALRLAAQRFARLAGTNIITLNPNIDKAIRIALKGPIA